MWPRVPACPCSAVMMPQRRQWGAFVSPWAPGRFPFFPLLNIMSLYQVRPAVARDAATIAAIHVNTWQEAYEGLLPEADLKAISVDKRLKLWREAIQYGDLRPLQGPEVQAHHRRDLGDLRRPRRLGSGRRPGVVGRRARGACGRGLHGGHAVGDAEERACAALLRAGRLQARAQHRTHHAHGQRQGRGNPPQTHAGLMRLLHAARLVA